jgi:predicted RNase H-like HicB family nuclease
MREGSGGRADIPLTVHQMIKLIEADGWTLERVRGSHRHYVHATKPGVGDRARQAEPGLAHRYRAQHPETGRYRQEAAVRTYAIIIERSDDGGYGAWSPDLPGCVALGDTEQEALSEMKEAMRGHLEVMRERGETIPNPSTVSATTVDAA